MGRTAKKSDIDLVLDKIDTDIEQLLAMKNRLIMTRADLQGKAMAGEPEKKSHKRKERPAAAPAAPAGI